MRGYLGLGSNLGNRMAELASGLEALESNGVRVVRRSSLYHTEPVGTDAPGWYLNAAAEVDYDGSPPDLLRRCLEVEASRGRVRGDRNGPRPLDLDFLLAGSLVIDSPELTLPHPRMHERRFVLVPMAEIAGEVVHPGLSRTIAELLRVCPDESRVERVSGQTVP